MQFLKFAGLALAVLFWVATAPLMLVVLFGLTYTAAFTILVLGSAGLWWMHRLIH